MAVAVITASIRARRMCGARRLGGAVRPSDRGVAAEYLLLVPVALLIGWFIAPRSVRQRVVSIYQPQGEVDSNRHRYATVGPAWKW